MTSFQPPAYNLKVTDIKYAKGACRVGITIPRPNKIKGVHQTSVYISGSTSAISEPTGLKFIYTNVPTTAQIALDGFMPVFDNCVDPIWEMDIRMVPQDPIDPCHKQAISSFNDVALMCGVQPPPLSYGDGMHCHASDSKSNSRIARFGPGHDCQVISAWVTT
jgi:hypothetical protein